MGYGFGLDEAELKQMAHEHFSFRRMIALFAPYRLLVLGLLTCVVIVAVLGLLPAYLIGQIIDVGIVRHDTAALIGLTLLSVAITLVMGSLLYSKHTSALWSASR